MPNQSPSLPPFTADAPLSRRRIAWAEVRGRITCYVAVATLCPAAIAADSNIFTSLQNLGRRSSELFEPYRPAGSPSPTRRPALPWPPNQRKRDVLTWPRATMFGTRGIQATTATAIELWPGRAEHGGRVRWIAVAISRSPVVRRPLGGLLRSRARTCDEGRVRSIIAIDREPRRRVNAS